MDRYEIKERLEKLCGRLNAQIKIVTISDPEGPRYTIAEENGRTLLRINSAHIDADRYESFLAYYVSKWLLPQLVLSTERLIIRRFGSKDAADCFLFLSDADGAYMNCCKAYASMDAEFSQLMEFYAQQETRYVIELKETGRVIGTVNLVEDDTRAVTAMEVGYSVSPEYQGKGYAFEAISALLNIIQNQLMYDMVVAGVLPENRRSIGLLEKLGFQKEGIRHNAIWHGALDKPVDLVYYYRDRE